MLARAHFGETGFFLTSCVSVVQETEEPILDATRE
jgi:hypothetical protein